MRLKQLVKSNGDCDAIIYSVLFVKSQNESFPSPVSMLHDGLGGELPDGPSEGSSRLGTVEVDSRTIHS